MSPNRRSEIPHPKSGNGPAYLFVFTRSLARETSARYLLRQANALSRQGFPVTLMLAAEAWSGDGDRGLGLADLGMSSHPQSAFADPKPTIYVLADAPPDGLPPELGVRPATDRDLAALMLDPLVTTYWC